MALQAAELRTVLVEHGVAEAAALRIVALAEQSIADERDRMNGQLAARDERFDRIVEQLGQLAEGQQRLTAQMDQLAEGQLRLTARMDQLAEGQLRLTARMDQLAENVGELTAAVKQLATEHQDFRLEQERFRSELVRIETEAKAERKAAQMERERIEREAKAEREAMEARIKIDLRNQILIGVGLVLGGLAVATGVILGVLG